MKTFVRCITVAAAVAALGGCALWPGSATDGQGSPIAPEPVVAPEPAYIPPPPPPPMPGAPDAEVGAAPPETDRGLPVCPGDPRCKKSPG